MEKRIVGRGIFKKPENSGQDKPVLSKEKWGTAKNRRKPSAGIEKIDYFLALEVLLLAEGENLVHF